MDLFSTIVYDQDMWSWRTCQVNPNDPNNHSSCCVTLQSHCWAFKCTQILQLQSLSNFLSALFCAWARKKFRSWNPSKTQQTIRHLTVFIPNQKTTLNERFVIEGAEVSVHSSSDGVLLLSPSILSFLESAYTYRREVFHRRCLSTMFTFLGSYW